MFVSAVACAISGIVACNRSSASDPIPPEELAPPPPLPYEQPPTLKSAAPSATAPRHGARPAPSLLPLTGHILDLTSLDASIDAAIHDRDPHRLGRLLVDLGATDSDVADFDGSRPATIDRMRWNLDDDADLEEVRDLRIPTTSGRASMAAFLLVLDPIGEEARVGGIRRFSLLACELTPSLLLRAEPVHDGALLDIVADWETIPACDGHAGATGTMVLTLARGPLEPILTWEDAFSFAPHSGRTLVPRRSLVFGGVAPRVARVMEGEHATRTMTFDTLTFHYR